MMYPDKTAFYGLYLAEIGCTSLVSFNYVWKLFPSFSSYISSTSFLSFSLQGPCRHIKSQDVWPVAFRLSVQYLFVFSNCVSVAQLIEAQRQILGFKLTIRKEKGAKPLESYYLEEILRPKEQSCLPPQILRMKLSWELSLLSYTPL